MNMIKNLGYRARLGIVLVVIAAILYVLNFVFFHDPHDLFFYISIDIAFLPIEILFVVLLIESAISAREKSILLEKLNMVIGTFFSEIGTHLLKNLSRTDSKSDEIRKYLLINNEWTEKEFKSASDAIKNYSYKLDISGDPESVEFLENLKVFLKVKRPFLLRLLENPNLLEHETFTELLRAVFHLTEELEKRKDISKLPPGDYVHLKGDIERAYGLLISEWIMYIEHLMKNYPYLFSLAMRVNPFDPNAKVEID